MGLDGGGGGAVRICMGVCSGFVRRFTNGKLLNEFVFNFFPSFGLFFHCFFPSVTRFLSPFPFAYLIVHDECIQIDSTKSYKVICACVYANNSRCGCCSTFITYCVANVLYKHVHISSG